MHLQVQGRQESSSFLRREARSQHPAQHRLQVPSHPALVLAALQYTVYLARLHGCVRTRLRALREQVRARAACSQSNAPPRARSVSVDAGAAVADDATAEAGAVPQPVVKIDNQHDPFATVVSVQFGDRLGELLDTVRKLSIGLICEPAHTRDIKGALSWFVTLT